MQNYVTSYVGHGVECCMLVLCGIVKRVVYNSDSTCDVSVCIGCVFVACCYDSDVNKVVFFLFLILNLILGLLIYWYICYFYYIIISVAK